MLIGLLVVVGIPVAIIAIGAFFEFVADMLVLGPDVS
jgi:hypothetical protein